MKTKIILSTALVVMLLNILLSPVSAFAQPSAATSSNANAISLLPGFAQVAPPSPSEPEPDWAEVERKEALVDRVEAYGLVTYNESYVAELSPRVYTLFSRTQAAEISEMVAEYNALPLVERRGERTFVGEEQQQLQLQGQAQFSFVGMTFNTGSGSSACKPSVKLKAYWWGVQTYMNSCFIKALQQGLDNPVITKALSWLEDQGKAGKIAAAVLKVYFKVYSAWLNKADDACKKTGAYLRAPWALIVLAWVKKTC